MSLNRDVLVLPSTRLAGLRRPAQSPASVATAAVASAMRRVQNWTLPLSYTLFYTTSRLWVTPSYASCDGYWNLALAPTPSASPHVLCAPQLPA